MPKRQYGTDELDRESKSGRFTKSRACDCCGRPVGSDYCTDDEVCQGGDGPGFMLCSRKTCGKLPGGKNVFDLPVEERRTHFTAQRAKIKAAGTTG